MSDLKISQLTALAAVDVASTDVLPIVDTSATTTKKITAADVATYVAGTSDITTPLAGKVSASLVDAKGDLLVGSADNTVVRLAVGTNTYVLTANSSATYGVEWAAVPASASDSENAIVAGAVFS
jgi:hypothetical protein